MNDDLAAMALLTGGIFVVVLLIRLVAGRFARTLRTDHTPANAIIVDGSNVMHWGGDPSILTLSRVLRALTQVGFHPIAYFDANVGYKLADMHLGPTHLAQQIGLPPRQVIIVPGGVQADGLILEHAVLHGLRVVTNDRFLDWKAQFPDISRRGFLVKGTWREGNVVWREKLRTPVSEGRAVA